MVDEQLTPGAKLLWENAINIHTKFGHEKTGLNHLIFSILEHHGKMTESIAIGLDANDYQIKIKEKLDNNDIGDEVNLDKLLENILECASKAGKQIASERDIVKVLLQLDGWAMQEQNAINIPRTNLDEENKKMDENQKESNKNNSSSKFQPRAKNKTPALESFGRDLCQEVINGNTKEILGRDIEIQAIMETLCRWTKRNPLLIGPAGVGKTAIIEGLAQRIVSGNVPAPIQGIRIFAIQPSSLISGAQMRGKLEERIEAILKEASQDGIVLFIDEIHSIVGSGGQGHISDISSQLKPALAKGEIACIGATTNDEYHRFIEDDRALERRFQPLRINELSAEATLKILESYAKRAKDEYGLTFTNDSLERIIIVAQQFIRNRNFPDKAIDIFEQTTAHALINEIKMITPEITQKISQQLIGMPIDLGDKLTERLNNVKENLTNIAFCPEGIAQFIIERLAITTRGLDVKPSRPNVTILAIGNPGQPPELVAQVLAEALYDNRDRLIEVDMTRFIHEADVNWLLGAPPGYIGHDRTLKFHQEISQQPWSVILFKDINLSHPKAQQILAQAIEDGYITTSHESKVYLSDATIIFSINTQFQKDKNFGFLPDLEEKPKDVASKEIKLQNFIIPDLIDVLDTWCILSPLSLEKVSTWITHWILPPICERYKRLGVDIEWEPNLVNWITNMVLEEENINYAEQLLEKEVLPKIAPYLSTNQKLTIEYTKGKKIQINLHKGEIDGIQN